VNSSGFSLKVYNSVRGQAEQYSRRYVEQLCAIHHLSRAVSQAEGIEELYGVALDSLERTLKVNRASILLFDSDSVMRFKAWRKLSEDYRNRVEGHSPWSGSDKNPTPILIRDVGEDPSLATLRQVILDEGIRAIGFIPLMSRSRLLGKFMIYYDAPHEFSEEEIQLAQVMASHIAFAIDRHRAEEVLKQQAQIINQVHDSVISTDLGGYVTSWNKGAEKLFGYTPREVVGKHISVIYSKEEQDFFQEQVIKPLEAKGNHELEVRLRRISGEEFYAHLSVSLLRDDKGSVTGMIGYLMDITERKRTEEALAQRAAELERSNAELEQFAYVASHDLQEPLRMVTSYAQLLAKRYQGKLDADADEFIGYIVGGASRMYDLINDLLVYSRVNSQAQKIEEADLQDVLERVLNNLRPVIESSGAIITHDPLPTVMANGFQLEQLFQNLISNAVKFRSEQSPRVHVTAKQKRKQWVFSVQDNGIGVDPQHRERIFVIFKRLHSQAEYPGTGIGLAICRKIVERHGGKMWVESQPGKGSTFYFTLPSHPTDKII
jgi:PAS domain S-box-containing protein